MNKTTTCVLVTGVGAIIGQGIIKSLRMTGPPLKIVGIDRNPSAFGAKYCDAFYAKPVSENDPHYPEFIKAVVQIEGVELIIPGIELDVFYFDENRELFQDSNVKLVLNHHALIEIAKDKWKTVQTLITHGIEPIPSTLSNEWSDCVTLLGPPPLIMKPRHGNGSRGIVILENERDFNYWKSKTNQEVMVQRIVSSMDEEYTVAVFGLGDGTASAPIILRRTLASSGSTLTAQVILEDTSITNMINTLNQLFAPIGPTNYQFRKEGDKTFLLEVNPRISSATSLRAAFNYNEAWMCVEYFLHGIPPEPINIKNGRAVRFVEDYVEYL
ncbi:ATP-grasp domain-containing protein [Geobacter sulfurreducens]|uniref:ATP-grasp domain-containing protein n=1 Tax=Geobacter sulfurreducens TaxID=35554 RepID=UPI0001E34274|nr:ATP-grasp domain-containing protein [Geobacter sulfurreducens]ADN78405.1 carbamoyl-phosphate synthase-like protein [Geobacter sulfurreducens KN400]